MDFGSGPSLTEAMKGQDVFIDAAGSPDPQLAIRLMDAAVAAGVYRFIPGEFSNDPKNQATRSLPVFQGKTQAFEHLQNLSNQGKITFTAISNGAFLDWGLRTSFVGIDLANKKIDLMNDGTHVFPWTHLSEVGKAVANAILLPEETKNQICYVYSIQKSQREVADLAKDVLGTTGWKTQRLDMNQAYENSMAAVKSGDFSFKVMADLIRYSISTPGYSGRLEHDDNELLGVQPMSDEQVKAMIKEIAEEKR